MARVASKIAQGRAAATPIASFAPLLRYNLNVPGFESRERKVSVVRRWNSYLVTTPTLTPPVAKNMTSTMMFNQPRSDPIFKTVDPSFRRLFQTASALASTPLKTASLVMRHQLPVLLLPLPSRRNEAGCEFLIRPSSTTVEQLLADIQKEDPGVEKIFVTVNGTRVAKRTAMQHLLAQGFDLHVNDIIYPVTPLSSDESPVSEPLEDQIVSPVAHLSFVDDPVEHELMSQTETEEVKDLVKNLYAVLNMRPHLMEQSAELRRQIEANRMELAALEQQLEMIQKNTDKKLVRFNFFNLFLMSVQFGMFARLTWWEYSWDIMEPVTYFTTTFHAMVLVYGWSVLTRKDLLYPVAADHFYLKWLYKLSGKNKFDIERYNALKEKIYEDESSLKRIRNPLESNFWISPPLPHSKQ